MLFMVIQNRFCIMKDGPYLAFSSAIGLAVGALAIYSFWYRKKKSKKWVQVATVDKLFVHPVKACRGIQVESYTCTEQGVMLNGSEIGDRCFLMTHKQGQYASIPQIPRMVLINISVTGKESIRLEAPDMEPFDLTIPKSGKIREYTVFGAPCQALDCGDEVADWLERFLKVETPRLVFHNQRMPSRKRDKLIGYGHLGVYAKEPVQSVFHNCCAFNMLSQASIDHLNTKLDAEHQVNVRYFRTNLLLKGCEAFAEDNFKRVKIGTAEFQFAKFTNRCPATTVNPKTGIMDKNRSTLAALEKFRLCKPEEKPIYRNLPKFCVDFVVTKEGKVNAGDKVYLYVDDVKE